MHIQYYRIKNSNNKFPTRLSTKPWHEDAGNSLHVDFECHSEENQKTSGNGPTVPFGNTSAHLLRTLGLLSRELCVA